MNRLSRERADAIASSLREAGAVLPCPRCGRSDITVLDWYILLHAQSQARNLVINGDNRVTCVATACVGCGYLAPHVIDILDGSKP